MATGQEDSKSFSQLRYFAPRLGKSWGELPHLRAVKAFIVVVILLGFTPSLGLAGIRNLTALLLTRRMSQEKVFQMPNVGDDTSRLGWRLEYVQGQWDWLPASSVKPVLKAWDALLAHRVEEAALALLEADDEQSRFTRSLGAFMQQSEKMQEGIWWTTVPLGLPEYYYGLALRAIQDKDWVRSREHFERAVSSRPIPWPDEFYAHYRDVLAKTDLPLTERLAREETASPSPAPEIMVGEKHRLGWEMPIQITGQWRLQGFTVRNWAAFDYGLPFTLDLFWLDNAGRIERQTMRTSNFLANGGFELGVPWMPGGVAGWSQQTDAGRFEAPTWQSVLREGQVSKVLVSLPWRSNRYDAKFTRLIPVRPRTYFLWSAWIENTEQGNPHLFAVWLDAGKRQLVAEIPMQGQAQGPGRTYAGVMQAPANAAYLSLTIVNWAAPGEALWDNLLLLPLTSPAP